MQPLEQSLLPNEHSVLQAAAHENKHLEPARHVATGIWESSKLISSTISIGLLFALLLLFLPISGSWDSVPDNKHVYWYSLATWASCYYLIGWFLVEAQLYICLKPANWSVTSTMLSLVCFFSCLWGMLYAGLTSTLPEKAVLYMPASLIMGLPCLHFDWLLRTLPKSGLSPEQHAYSKFDWLWDADSLHSGYESATLVLIILSIVQWSWLQISVSAFQNIGEDSLLLYTAVTASFYLLKVGCVRTWGAYGAALENSSFDQRYQLLTIWGCECIIAIFFKIMFASLRSWSSFSAVVSVATAAKAGLFFLQTTPLYFDQILPKLRALACLSPYGCSFEEHLYQHSLSTFCTVFADVLSGVVILVVYPLATSCNNKAFYVSQHLPSIASANGKRLVTMYAIQLVVDVLLAFVKRLRLTRQDVDNCQQVIRKVLVSWSWSCLMIMLIAHFIQDALLALVDPKVV